MSTMLALLCGVLISIANLSNSKLGEVWGQYYAPILIHVIALILITCLSRGKLKSVRKVPKFYLFGGLAGLGTTIFCNISTTAMGVTLMMVLSLLGQTVSSMIVDGFGIMGLEKKKISKNQVISLGLIVIGAVVMIVW